MTDLAALPAEDPPLALAEQVPAAVLPFMPFTGQVVQAPPPAVLPPVPSNVIPFAQPENQQLVPGATGLPPVDMARLSAELVTNQRNKMITDERINRAREQTLARDQARTEKAYQQTGIGPDSEINSRWNADEAREKYRYDPVKEFGSIGSLFAIAASAFTKRPMENALAGSAAAMNAVKEGNAAEYDRAYKAWHDNTNLAIKRQGIMQQQYQNSISMMTTNMAAGEASMKINAVRFGDKETLTLLENGMSPQVIDLLAKRNDLATKLEKSRNELSIEGLKTQDLMARTQGLKPGTPEFQRAVQFHQVDWTNRKYDEDADFARNFWAKNPEASPEEFRDAFGKFKNQTSEGAGTRAITPAQKAFQAEIKERERREPTSEEWTEFNVAQRGTPTKPRQLDAITQTYANEIREREKREPTSAELVEFNQQRKAVTVKAGTKLEPADATFLAEQALRGDTSVFTNLGRGAQGAENVIAVRKEIRRLGQERGLSGQDMALQNAEYQGLRAGMRVAGSREAIIGTAANEAINMMVVAKEVAATVPRSRWVPINQLAQYAGRQASYPELAAFAQANESLVNGYVRAISPTGVPTDLVRKHAYNALTTAQGPEAYAAVLDIMEKEMQAALSAPDQVRQQFITREKKIRSGDHSPLFTIGSKGSGSGAIQYDSNGNRVP